MASDIQAGYYRLELNKTVWEIPERYTKLRLIGTGAYGQVCSAHDKELNTNVAIKKLSRPFQTKLHAKRAYREIRILKHMNHENVLGLLDIFTPAISLAKFKDPYLVTQLMGPDLYKVVQKNHPVDDGKIQIWIYQILRGLKYIHSAGIIHRDLKPSNIAVTPDNDLKILDFGLARQEDTQMTGYVATRWYRAPEVLFNWMHYTKTVDIWSVGCILAELIRGKPLFRGKDYMDQLTEIMSYVGTPKPELMQKMTSDDAKIYINSLKTKEKKDFKVEFEGTNPLAIDLLEKMLELDPEVRITAEEALAHAYMKTYYDPSDEPVCERLDQTIEDSDLPVDEWRRLIYVELNSFVRPPMVEDT